MALQPDGKIVAAGIGSVAGDFALARYNPNGPLDTSFDGDGKLTTDFGGFDEARASRSRPTARSSRGLDDVVGGDFALARYNANGSLDASFGGDGKQRTAFVGFLTGATA